MTNKSWADSQLLTFLPLQEMSGIFIYPKETWGFHTWLSISNYSLDFSLCFSESQSSLAIVSQFHCREADSARLLQHLINGTSECMLFQQEGKF